MSPNSTPHPYASQDPVLRRSLPGKGAKVLVALSGGRNSGLTAALLQDQGYEVYALFLNFLPSGVSASSTQRTRPSCTQKSRDAAEAMAQSLNVPFFEAPMAQSYSGQVLQKLVEDALQGHKSSACTLCQGSLRFGPLIKKADELDVPWIATGHYARLSEEPGMGTCLWRGKDIPQDQSYFLSRLPASQMRRLILPMGHLKEDEIERLADQHQLPSSPLPPASAGTCFVQNQTVWQHVEKRMGFSASQQGLFITRDKHVLGEHEGVHAFQIGQSEGLDYARTIAESVGLPDAKDYCVVGLDPWKQWVILDRPARLSRSACLSTAFNWVVPPDFRRPRPLMVQLGYDPAKTYPVQVQLLLDNHVRMESQDPAFHPRPGDSCVLYDKHLCLGGAEVLDTYLDPP